MHEEINANLACLTFLSLQNGTKYPFRFDFQVSIWWKPMITNQVGFLQHWIFHTIFWYPFFRRVRSFDLLKTCVFYTVFLNHAIT